jgi:nucleoid-associated protein YgaU
MAVSITSRYRSLGVQDFPDTQGTTHPSVPIRRHRAGAPDPRASQYRHIVTGVETIEYLSFRFYANSESWWRIADANPVRYPLDARPGDALTVPSSNELQGTTDRTRTFR